MQSTCGRIDCLDYDGCTTEHHKTHMNNCMSHSYSTYDPGDEKPEEMNMENAIRELVAAIFNDCFGAYGSDERYQGQYETEIQNLIGAIEGKKLKRIK